MRRLGEGSRLPTPPPPPDIRGIIDMRCLGREVFFLPAPAPAAPDGGISSRAPPPPRDVRRFVVTGPRVVRRGGGRGGMIGKEGRLFLAQIDSGKMASRTERGEFFRLHRDEVTLQTRSARVQCNATLLRVLCIPVVSDRYLFATTSNSTTAAAELHHLQRTNGKTQLKKQSGTTFFNSGSPHTASH